MLKTFRGSGNSKAMWVIIGLLMLGLTGFGISGLTGGVIRTIGKVGEEPIEIAPYAQALQNAIARMNVQAGRTLSPAEIQESGIQQRVLDAVVGVAALDNEVAQMGLSVGDEAVRKAILASGQFTRPDGTFDRETYTFFLERQLGVSPREYESLVRKQLARAILETALASGVRTDGADARVLLAYAREERSAEWAEITPEMLPEPIPEPTEDELRAYWEANKERYMTPETRRITYAWLSPADLVNEVEISEDVLRGAYQDQHDRFNTPERRVVERLVFPDEAAAQAAKARLDAGEASFEDLVSERGLTSSDVSLGEVERERLSGAAADAVFGTPEPGVVGPVKTALGPALFRVTDILEADSTPFEEAREELRQELALEEAKRRINALVSEIDDMLAAGATLEELGEETPMQTGSLGFNEQSSEPITGYQAFREAALAAEEGDFPELRDLEDGGVFALRLDTIEPPREIPFEEARDRVAEDLRAERTAEALRAQAERLMTEIARGEEPEVLAWNVEETVRRNSFIDDLPPESVERIFALEQPGDLALVEDTGRVVLIRLTDISAYDLESDEAKALIEAVRAERDQMRAADLVDLFARAAQERAGVTLNTAAINQINSQIMGLQ